VKLNFNCEFTQNQISLFENNSLIFKDDLGEKRLHCAPVLIEPFDHDDFAPPDVPVESDVQLLADEVGDREELLVLQIRAGARGESLPGGAFQLNPSTRFWMRSRSSDISDGKNCVGKRIWTICSIRGIEWE
jgi:hypothetical protein